MPSPDPESVTCPCCGGTFPAFQPHGRIPRPGARCPSCGALERHRLIFLYLLSRTRFFRDDLRVLHFAPEGCFHRWFRRLPNLEYTSADLMSPHAMERIDITDIPYPDDTFDTVLCSHVLEHVPDDRAAMAEVRRVLRPGGFAILHVPIDRSREQTFEDDRIVSPEDREKAFGQHDHVRLYGRDFAERLEAAGFHVEVEAFGQDLRQEDVRRFGLRRNELIHRCTKPRPDADEGVVQRGDGDAGAQGDGRIWARGDGDVPAGEEGRPIHPTPVPQLVAQAEERRGWTRGPGPLREIAGRVIPLDATVVVVSRGDDEIVELDGRTGWHFPQAEGGVYAGHHPADSLEAVEHLEALRSRGGEYLLLPDTSFWWLDHYEGFREHLDSRYSRVWDDEVCVVYHLAPQ
jgi:SAM-dependent methyltransferase